MAVIIYPEIPRVQYTAAPAQTNFAYPWPIITQQDLSVYKTALNSIANNADLLVLNVDYTVSDAGIQAGGNVTLTQACTGGEVITIERTTAIEKTSYYSNGAPINANDLNADFNKLFMICQNLQAYITRIATLYPVPAVISEGARTLPLLPAGYFWKGGTNNSVLAVVSEENPDASTLRSELANNASSLTAGANLVGYYDTDSATSMTVNQKLDDLTAQITNNILSIIDFGGDPTGVGDNTPALNSALSYFAANPESRNLWFPAGTYLFESKPDDITLPVRIFGDGPGNTFINVAYDETGATGFLQFVGVTDGQVQLMIINKINTHTGGSAIAFISDGISVGCQNPAVLDVIISSESGSYWNYGVVGDNSDLDLAMNSAIINNVIIYGCDTYSFYGISFVSASISGLETYVGYGSVSIIALLGTATRISTANIVDVRSTTTLSLDYITNTSITGASILNVFNTANCSNISVYGYVQNKQYNWPALTCNYISSSDFGRSLTSTNGYQKLPGGIIIQWVHFTTPSSPSGQNSLITLPTAFSTVNLGVMALVPLSNNINNLYVDFGASTLTTVNVFSQGTGAKRYRVVVWGI